MDTRLFWLQSRYYDSTVGRFINADDISYLDPETLNGLNIYAYCGNNVVMGYDPAGTRDLKWWEKLLIGVGLFIVGAAITFFTAGTGAAGIAALGAFTVGFAKTAVVGMAIGGTIGAISGGISGGWQGAVDGFGNAAADAFMFAGLGSAIGSIGNGILAVSATRYSNAVGYLKANGVDDVAGVMKAFKGIPKVKAVKNGKNVYRYWDGVNAGQFGRWVTPKAYSNPAQKLALAYGNTATNMSRFAISQGRHILVGRVAGVYGFSGGGIQYFLGSANWLKLIK